jgi:hypothetical protein
MSNVLSFNMNFVKFTETEAEPYLRKTRTALSPPGKGQGEERRIERNHIADRNICAFFEPVAGHLPCNG